jgi:hypothetical protein
VIVSASTSFDRLVDLAEPYLVRGDPPLTLALHQLNPGDVTSRSSVRP